MQWPRWLDCLKRIFGLEQLDAIDLKILQTLVGDGRISWQTLADHIGLSLTPTLRRVRRLEAEQYIFGYTAAVNEKMLGRPINAIMFIDLEKQTKDACEICEAHLFDLPALRLCAKVTGRPDYLANIWVHDMAEFEKVLSDVSAIPGIAKVRSNLILKLIRPYGPLRSTGT